MGTEFQDLLIIPKFDVRAWAHELDEYAPDHSLSIRTVHDNVCVFSVVLQQFQVGKRHLGNMSNLRMTCAPQNHKGPRQTRPALIY